MPRYAGSGFGSVAQIGTGRTVAWTGPGGPESAGWNTLAAGGMKAECKGFNGEVVNPATGERMEIMLLVFSYVAILGIGYRVQKSPGGTPLRWLTFALAAASVLFVLWTTGQAMAAELDAQ